MSEPDVREMLKTLERDVTAVPLAPAGAIRSRGEAKARHRRMTIVAAVIAAIGLGVGAIVVEATPAPHASQASAPAQAVPVQVILDLDATDAQKQAVQKELRSLHVIGSIKFIDREQAWLAFKKQFEDAPDLVAATKPDSLPEKYELTLADRADVDKARALLGSQPGVSNVLIG